MSKTAADWYTERLRLTVFMDDPALIDKAPALSRLFESEVELTEIRPKRKVEVASYGAGKVQLIAQPERIDFLWSAVPDEDGPGNLGAREQAYAAFLPRLEPWLSEIPKVNRVAIGAIFGLEAESKEDGYRKLQPYIPELTLDPVDSSEFSYQINNHLEFDLGNRTVTLNRLKKWAVRSIQMAKVEASSGMLVESQIGRAYFSPGCEHDFSSPALDASGFTGAEAVAIVRKLMDESLAVLKRGA